jgi:hypothetical protein
MQAWIKPVLANLNRLCQPHDISGGALLGEAVVQVDEHGGG